MTGYSLDPDPSFVARSLVSVSDPPRPMSSFIGKEVAIRTELGTVQGKLLQFDKESGRILIEDAGKSTKELDLLDVLEVNLMGTELTAANSDSPPGIAPIFGQPITENDMHSLFYEAFNVYGPFEDSFCATISLAIKKFLRDVSSSKICVIVGSDDIFGRVGLCFARTILGKCRTLDVLLQTDICDLRTVRYREAFLNSGGHFLEQQREAYTMVLFACNRHHLMNNPPKGSISLLVDLPNKAPPFPFTGLGLGFVPENYTICSKLYYIIDVGFGAVLANKYGAANGMRGSLVKMEMNGTDK